MSNVDATPTEAAPHSPPYLVISLTTPFPELVRALAVEAFAGAWEPSYAVRNIRRACRLLKQAGAVSADEPAVE